jgi:hypothetical protein
MKIYRVTLSKEHGGKYISSVVDAKDEQEAFIKVRDIAIEQGIELPDEIWTRTEEVKSKS